MQLVINIEKKHFLILVVLISLFSLLLIGTAGPVNPDQPWHPLSQIAKSTSDTNSVDSDGNGFIDSADTATEAINATHADQADNADHADSVDWNDVENEPITLTDGDNQNLSNVLDKGNDAGGQRITNLADPNNPQDATTRNYVDNNDAVNDADSDPTNEIQNLYKNSDGDICIVNPDGADYCVVDSVGGSGVGTSCNWNGEKLVSTSAVGSSSCGPCCSGEKTCESGSCRKTKYARLYKTCSGGIITEERIDYYYGSCHCSGFCQN